MGKGKGLRITDKKYYPYVNQKQETSPHIEKRTAAAEADSRSGARHHAFLFSSFLLLVLRVLLLIAHG